MGDGHINGFDELTDRREMNQRDAEDQHENSLDQPIEGVTVLVELAAKLLSAGVAIHSRGRGPRSTVGEHRSRRLAALEARRDAAAGIEPCF
jgi:hypothetical protein